MSAPFEYMVRPEDMSDPQWVFYLRWLGGLGSVDAPYNRRTFVVAVDAARDLLLADEAAADLENAGEG